MFAAIASLFVLLPCAFADPVGSRVRVSTSDPVRFSRWLDHRGWKHHALPDGRFEVEIAVDSLARHLEAPGLMAIENSQAQLASEPDDSRNAIGGALVHAGVGLKHPRHGAGVLVGIVDIGFDLNHPAFTDSTGTSRIIRLWDQTGKSTNPPKGFSNGTLYPASALASLGHSASQSHHGTHVTGLAAGRAVAGSGGDWWGVADQAKIALVECGEGCPRIVDAVKYLFQLGDSLKMPVVVNLSWGTLNGPRDGKSPECVQFGNMVGKGKVAVVSAGNSGGEAGHVRHAFAGDTAHFALEVAKGVSLLGKDTLRRVFFNEAEFWGDSTVQYRSWVEFIDSATGVLVAKSPVELVGSTTKQLNWSTTIGSDTAWVSGQLDSRSGQGGARLSISTNRRSTLLRTGMTAATGTVNGWIWESGLEFLALDKADCSDCVIPDHEQMISDMASCPNLITVGAIDASTATATYFTSRGPGRGRTPKPDLAAPGSMVISSLNSWVHDGRATSGSLGLFTWGPMSGTSMSAPLVTGAVALLLEEDSSLTPDQALALLKQQSVSHDVAIGWGMLDVFGVFQTMDKNAVAQLPKAKLQFPTPTSQYWITPDGRRLQVPAGREPLQVHPGGVAWLQVCLAGQGCSTQGVAKPK